MDDTFAVIGAGNMGEAIIAGMVNAGTISADRVVCADQSADRLRVMADRYGVATASTHDAIRAARVVLLAVKPQNLPELLAAAAAEFVDGQIVVTIVAGVPLAVYRAAIHANVAVVRAMPNTPAQLGVGVTALAVVPGTLDTAVAAATEIFASVGSVVTVEESELDAVTAVSGSGPAYVFLFAEALIDAGVAAGLHPDTARQLTIHTLYGSGVMLRDAGREPHELRQMVSSPGGTTVAALAEFAAHGFVEMVTGAVAAAKRRAAELAREAQG